MGCMDAEAWTGSFTRDDAADRRTGYDVNNVVDKNNLLKAFGNSATGVNGYYSSCSYEISCSATAQYEAKNYEPRGSDFTHVGVAGCYSTVVDTDLARDGNTLGISLKDPQVGPVALPK